MTNSENSYCSWCFVKTRHTLKKHNLLTRNIYICSKCNGRTVECRYCKNMARGGDKWDDECCAVHDGSIADFRTLKIPLSDITKLRRITKRSGKNMVKVGKIAGGVGAVAVVATGVGAVAAPAIGGAIGSLGGLSGAAATSHGLAVLGGGALSAGGLGMAGGTVAVALTVGSLGGVGGGILVNKYVGDIQGFDIKKRHAGKSDQPNIIFVNGFLNQNQSLIEGWKPTLQKHYPSSNWYEVDWESKKLRDLGALAAKSGSKKAFTKIFKEVAKKAKKQSPKKLGPLAVLSTLLDLGGNPFWVALHKAQQTGYLLADLIIRTGAEKRYVLMGHSLGARVCYFTLQALSKRKEGKRISEVHLLGGAVGSAKKDWYGLSSAVMGKIYNYYSLNDDILRILYSTSTLFQSAPIGRNKISIKNKTIRSYDVTKYVPGHTKYKTHLADYLKRGTST
jgi:hypothetical protein